MIKLELSFLPDVGDRHTGKIAIRHPATYLDRLKEIPGYAFSTRGNVSTVPKAWPSVLALGTLANRAKIALSPDDEVLDWYKKTAKEWEELRSGSALLFRGDKEPGFSYYPHQIAGAEWLLIDSSETGRALLDQTGAGKTGTFIRALQVGKLTEKGPVLVICPESVMTTGWAQSLEMFAPELRVIEMTGTPAQRRKKFDLVADGQFDVVIIGYSNLRTHTRFEAFPGQALRRCVQCGGSRLTTGKTDENGNPLPDIIYHDNIPIRQVMDRESKFVAVCRTPDCGWASEKHPYAMQAAFEAAEHSLKFKKISELTPAQCQTHHKDLNEIGWSVIIADEIHRALNPHSQTTQALWGVAKYAPGEPRRWGATGTPLSTKVDQVWPILHYLNPVAWPTKSKWVDWYCDAGYSYSGFWEVRGLRPEMDAEFQATFSGISRRVLKDQVLDLPPKLRWNGLEERLTMPRTGEQFRVYNEMKEEMLAMVEEGSITAMNVLVQARRLSMMASGTGYPLDSDGSMGLRMPSVKVDALIQMWQDREWEGEQIGIMFSSLKALRMTEQALYEANLITPHSVAVVAGDVPQDRRSLDINDFQAGKREVVMLTYAAGGTGITLTAASTVIVFERDWSPILNLQGEDRFHRIGSERHSSITYRDLVVENSNEIAQLARMDQNADTLESIVHDRDRLRAIFGG